jgi:G:T-mismatch repair DNA endonuclease (very short patch repair protein)
MPSGIYIRTKKHKDQLLRSLGTGMLGHHHSKRTKETISRKNRNLVVLRTKFCACGCGDYFVENLKQPKKYLVGHGTRGKSCPGNYHPPSEAAKAKMRATRKGQSSWNKGIPWSVENRKKNSDANKGRPKSAVFRAKMSKVQNQRWKDPSYIQKQMKSRGCRPNRPELQLQKLLENIDPDNWIYVGDGQDKQYILGGRVPDFVHSSKTLIIELFGDYWHGKEFRGIPVEEHVRERTEHFVQHGYQTLIVWEHDLQNIQKIQALVREFLYGLASDS